MKKLLAIIIFLSAYTGYAQTTFSIDTTTLVARIKIQSPEDGPSNFLSGDPGYKTTDTVQVTVVYLIDTLLVSRSATAIYEVTEKWVLAEPTPIANGANTTTTVPLHLTKIKKTFRELLFVLVDGKAIDPKSIIFIKE